MSRITFISRMTIKPGREQDFVDACNELTAQVKAHEPDVIYYEFFKLREPRRYAVLESFPSEEVEHAHMNSASLAAIGPAHRRLSRRHVGARIPGPVQGLTPFHCPLRRGSSTHDRLHRHAQDQAGPRGRVRAAAGRAVAAHARQRAGHQGLRHHPFARQPGHVRGLRALHATTRRSSCTRPRRSTIAWCRRSWRPSPATWTSSSSTTSPDVSASRAPVHWARGAKTSRTLPGMWKYSP